MEPLLPFTALLNRFFAAPVTALLHTLGIPVLHPQEPIPNYVAMQILVALLLVMLFLIVRSRLSVEKPGGLQHMMEDSMDSSAIRAMRSSVTIMSATFLYIDTGTVHHLLQSARTDPVF